MFNDIIKRKDDFVFLGGTCNESNWRDTIINSIKIKYFNPIVKDWTSEHQKIEKEMRDKASIVLYVITPKMTGVYSIAEAVDDSNKRPDKTAFCFLPKDGELSFDEGQIKSLNAVADMITSNGATYLKTLNDVVDYINSKAIK